MFSRPLAFILLALGCVTAAAGGAYVATRQNAAQPATPVASSSAQSASPVASAAPASPAQPVAETEAAVTSAKPEVPARVETSNPSARAEAVRKSADPASSRRRATENPAASPATRAPAPAPRTVPANGAPAAPPVEPQAAPVAAPPPVQVAETPRPIEPQPEPPRVPQFEDVILPASSVIGLQLESTLTTERARVEDRVDARVTRDVLAAGRVAIPAGSRVRGSVTTVERGGKVKERARLGVRFHTLILSDGSEVPLQTEAIYREGESPAGDSAKKIGVAAVGGAILGGILGGGKGAIVGGATGAAGGTAAVMQGDRHAASLRGGEIVTARLSSPATITVARRE
jgi:type IV secretory pathway VirB10-like protein